MQAMRKFTELKQESVLIAFVASFSLALFAAWLTHVMTCFSDDRWTFLIAGALFFPVAIVHGVGIWFGAW